VSRARIEIDFEVWDDDEPARVAAHFQDLCDRLGYRVKVGVLGFATSPPRRSGTDTATP